MKLSQLRPCDACHGRNDPTFYVVEYSQAIVTAAAGREHEQRAGLTLFFGGAAGLASVFVPEDEDAILVFGERDKNLKTKLLICQACFLNGPIDLVAIGEQARSRAEQRTEAAIVNGGFERNFAQGTPEPWVKSS